MNANSLPKTLAIKEWLAQASAQLQTCGIATAKLDAEIIVAHTINRGRTYLHAHGEVQLSSRQQEIADARLQLRLDRTPIAYIIGHKEFYGRRFHVTTATLIPRPESEAVIEILRDRLPRTAALIPEIKHLVDVGTGSGCLGITAKLEFPDLDVTLIDISRHALRVAEQNAAALRADVRTAQGDLLEPYPLRADYMLANLPYVDPQWRRSPETDHEPELALFAEDNGLALIERLIAQAPRKMNPGGLLLLEADPRQHAAIVRLARAAGFSHVETRDFIVCVSKD